MMGRQWAMSLPAMDGGVPVSLSKFGKAFFFLVGACAGTAASIILSLVLPPRVPAITRVASEILLMSAALGFFAAPALITLLLWTFFAIPRELFDLLFDTARLR